MKKIRNNSNKTGNTVLIHLKKHHKKYLFGIFGGYAVVKMFVLLLGLLPILSVKNTFADNGAGQETTSSSSQTLVRFNEDLSPTWTTEDTAEIERLNGATGGYAYYFDNDISSIAWGDAYIPVNEAVLTLSFSDMSNNDKYICAFGQKGNNTQTVCSQNKIQIDVENPEVSLTYPLGVNLPQGTNVIMRWSGWDEHSGVSGYVLTIVDPSGSSNSNSYGWNNTSSNQISLNAVGTRYRSVKVYDNTFHSARSTTGSFNVYESTGGVTGPFIRINKDLSPTWTTQDTAEIERLNGATGGYAYFSSNNASGIVWSGYTPVSTSILTLSFNDESNSNKYLCAFGQYGSEIESICSNNKIKIDISNPHISQTYPSDGATFQKGSNIVVKWAGWDDFSGISGYVLTIVNPSGSSEQRNFGANTTTSNIITLNTIGTRDRSVIAYDNLSHSVKSTTGYFEVYESTGNNDNPNGGDSDTGFYLISPVLGEQLYIGNNVTLDWNYGSANSGFIREVKKINGATVLSGYTTGNSVTINSGYFTIGAYSWSVKNLATSITKSVAIFYIVDNSNFPDLKIDQFEFDEIEDADLDEYVSSNTITIAGLSDGWYNYAYLLNGKGALYINGDFVGTDGFIKNGDKVHIEMKASDEYDEQVKTTLIVGAGNDKVSGVFKVTTKDGIHNWDNPSLTPMQKLRGIVFVDNLVEMYKYDEKKLAIFLSTFMQVLQDKSDYYAKMIKEAEEDGDDDLLREYKLYKEAIDFLYVTVKYRYNNIEVEDITVYIAPNGKQYLVEYDESRMAYTSPDFVRAKYFPTRELFKNHIDINNPAVGKRGIEGNVITTHNGKVYTIYETNGKRTSSNFRISKYFDTKDDIVNYILANNPASNWSHTIDTDFKEVVYTAPNGNIYRIFKTSSKGNNPNMYTSYDFVDAKYFTSLEAAKKFIDQNNRK